MLTLVFQHHPHRSVANFGRELVCRGTCHGSILFGSWSLRQTRGGSLRTSHEHPKGNEAMSELGRMVPSSPDDLSYLAGFIHPLDGRLAIEMEGDETCCNQQRPSHRITT